MKWFKHDCDASVDSRIRKLKQKYGMIGYGIFFNTLELIARKMEKDISSFGFLPDEWDDEALEMEFGQSSDTIRTMFDYMCQIGLFEKKDGKLYNVKIQERCDDYTARLLRSASNSEQDTNSVRTKSDKVRLDKNRIDKNKIDNNIITTNVVVTDEGRVTTPLKETLTKKGEVNINPLMGRFKELNPTYERLYARPPQRAALLRLVEKFGYEKLDGLLVKLPQIVSLPYSPQITTPIELENKFGALVQFMQKEKGKEGGEYANGKSKIGFVS